MQLVSVNYKNHGVALRERFAQLVSYPVLEDLLSKHAIDEAVLLSTCNRVELYYCGRLQPQELVQACINQHAAQSNALSSAEDYRLGLEIEPLYQSGDDALAHLFRVTASLESMVIGEAQILGQVKQSFRLAQERGLVKKHFLGLFPHLLRTAKRVRSDTQIAKHPLSVGQMGVNLARSIYADIKQRSVLIVGAGEIAELALKQLIKNGVERICIINRTLANASSLALKFNAKAYSLSELQSILPSCDIIITSATTDDYLIGVQQAQQAIQRRNGNPQLYIDIAVPRNIDPAINELGDVYYYGIDALQEVADKNMERRRHCLHQALSIIEQGVANYKLHLRQTDVAGVIKSLRSKLEGIAQDELRLRQASLAQLTPAQRSIVEDLLGSVLKKILHAPSINTKQMAADERFLYTELLQELFDLDDGSAELILFPQPAKH